MGKKVLGIIMLVIIGNVLLQANELYRITIKSGHAMGNVRCYSGVAGQDGQTPPIIFENRVEGDRWIVEIPGREFNPIPTWDRNNNRVRTWISWTGGAVGH